MTFPRLQAIVDVDVAIAAGWSPQSLSERYLRGGARWLQIRAKTLRSGPLLELCDEIVELAKPYGSTIIVNDRADLAKLSGAGGVHLGQEDLAPAYARTLLGDDALIGYSTHTNMQVAAARKEPLSYLAVGPVFDTESKETGQEAIGLEFVQRAAASIGQIYPLVGIGGITLDRAPRVLEAGASAVAVITDLLVGSDPTARVQEYLSAIA